MYLYSSLLPVLKTVKKTFRHNERTAVSKSLLDGPWFLAGKVKTASACGFGRQGHTGTIWRIEG